MESGTAPRRDLVVAAVTIVGMSRFAEGPLVWVVGAILLAALLLGALQVHAETDPAAESAGVPVEALLTPAVAGLACVGAIRLVPIGLALVPALVVAAIIVDRILRTEGRILASPRGATPADNGTLLAEAIVIAFLGFVGAAALVPGGLPEPGAAGLGAGAAGGAGAPMSEANLLLLAAADALIAGLLGYRVSAIRVSSLRDALWSAATYASAVAIGAAALRAMDIPRLIGPAILALIFFLWDAFHGAPPSRRRDPRWIWQTLLLAAVGVAVVAWNLRLR
ncbi:MAG TPA: hypothetical protein VGC90_02370 [Candidatus Limnocylindrales bacterium]